MESGREIENADVTARLVANHRRFLAFVQRRVGSRSEAEDILQTALVRGLEKGGSIRNTDSTVAWFYRLLRNALADHYRKAGTEARIFAPATTEDEDEAAYEAELRGEICACLRSLIPALKPEYSEMVRRVDLDEEPLGRVAGALGITLNNATVRLHRARAALRRQLELTCRTCATHGCLDCRCTAAQQTAG